MSVRSVSVVIAMALGLMACAGQSRGTSAYAGHDPSSIYQPTPSSPPLAVNPPITVTGTPGTAQGVPGCEESVASSGSGSPNRRLCP
ncbi:hypothetical protein [Pendulispora albinea]|uniref:Lipoprotein n=1 Tax=Pendulispora albinea TaxID=2741071 RepID=A0ABZ2LSL0_9BACT